MISNSISPVPEAKDFLKTDLTQENNQSGLGNLFPVPKAKNISCTEFHLFAFSMGTVCLRACWFKSRLLGSPLATRFASGHLWLLLSDIMAVAAWETSWKKTPARWVDYPNSLVRAFDTFKKIEHEVPRLREYAQQVESKKLRDMPWMAIAREIANGVNRQDARLESAEDMMSIEQLRNYVEDWRKKCVSVDNLIKWQLFPTDNASKILAEFSRPGAYEQPFLCWWKQVCQTVTLRALTPYEIDKISDFSVLGQAILMVDRLFLGQESILKSCHWKNKCGDFRFVLAAKFGSSLDN